MNESPPTISPEEQEQIIQTIEMFEVIVEANPRDTQSMEILKEAYQRVGLRKEIAKIGRRLAETYVEQGQLSLALLEFEGILQQDQDNPEIIAALGDVEERMHRSGLAPQYPYSGGLPIALDFQAAGGEQSALIATPDTVNPATFRNTGRAAHAQDIIASLSDDNSEPLAKFLIQHRLASEDTIVSALQHVQKKNKDRAPSEAALSLIGELVRRGAAELDTLLCGLLDRTKFAYIPLEYYDVDRQIVKMLPEALTLGRLILPFDLMSRTMMIATANPLDVKGREAVQHFLDYHIQWHLADPAAIHRVLAETYRVPGKTGMRLSS